MNKDFYTNKKVIIEFLAVEYFMTDIATTNILDWLIGKVGYSVFDSVINVSMYPIDLYKYFDIPNQDVTVYKEGNVEIHGKKITGSVSQGDTGIVGIEIDDSSRSVLGFDFNLNLPEYDFTYFNPYSKYYLHLPFYGFLELSAQEIIGFRISCWYSIDFDNGKCVISLKKYVNGEHITFMEVNTEIGIRIPLTKVDTTSAYDAVLKTITTAGAGILSGSVNAMSSSKMGDVISQSGAGATESFFKHEVSAQNQALNHKIGTMANTISAATSASPSVVRGEYGGAYLSTIVPNAFDCYIIKETMNYYEPENYAHTVGKPLMQTKVLNTLTGYTVVEGCHLENIDNATVDELSAIQSALMSGVIL